MQKVSPLSASNTKEMLKIKVPLDSKETLADIKVGDFVLLTGWLLCARDATHRKILNALKEGSFSFDFTNQFIYYVGPSPTPPGKIIGSCGPTTSTRMDPYLEEFFKLGIAGTIGKGKRSQNARELHQLYGTVYLITFGGAGAYLTQFVEKLEPLAWQDLGPEAFFRIKVTGFPAIVGIDIWGNDFYELSSERTPP